MAKNHKWLCTVLITPISSNFTVMYYLFIFVSKLSFNHLKKILLILLYICTSIKHYYVNDIQEKVMLFINIGNLYYFWSDFSKNDSCYRNVFVITYIGPIWYLISVLLTLICGLGCGSWYLRYIIKIVLFMSLNEYSNKPLIEFIKQK